MRQINARTAKNREMMLEYERIHANEVDTYIPKGMPKIQPEKPKKKFVRYDEGAELYSMSQKRFEKLAKEANAVYKLNRMVLVNMDIIDEYLETFHLMRKR